MNEDAKMNTAPAAAKNGEAPRRKFGSANNFSSDSVSRDRRRGGRNDRRNNPREHTQEEKLFDEQTVSIDRVSRTVKNLVSKSIGSTNKVNVAYATIKALSELKPRAEWVGNKAKKEEK